MKKLFIAVSILIISGCMGIVEHPKIGDTFRDESWAYKNGFYYVGEYDGKELYRKDLEFNNRTDFKGGILVSNKVIIGILNEDEIKPFLNRIEVERKRKIDAFIKIKADAEREAKREKEQEDAAAEQKLEQCFDSRVISVCQQSNGLPTLLTTLAHIQGITQNIYVGLYVKNRLSIDVKDVIFSCDSIAESGTVLDTENVKIFKVFPKNTTLDLGLTIRKVEQYNSIKCHVSGYTKI